MKEGEGADGCTDAGERAGAKAGGALTVGAMGVCAGIAGVGGADIAGDAAEGESEDLFNS